jgi:hypothetical protein
MSGASVRRPTGFAAVYVVASMALAAVVFLTHATYMNAFIALVVLNLPVSLPAYFVVYALTVLGQPIGDDLLWIRIVGYLIWITLVVVQASMFQTICHQYREAARQRRL